MSAMEVLRGALEDLERREAKLQKEAGEFDAECGKKRAAAEIEMGAEREEIERKRARLEEDSAAILKRAEQVRGSVDHDLSAVRSRVRLNVGGAKFETTVGTLTKIPDSYFSAAFSGRHEVPLDSEGCYFIDRDGTHFRPILNWMRGGSLKLQRDSASKDELMSELAYYMLADAHQASLSSEAVGVTGVRWTRERIVTMIQQGVTIFPPDDWCGLDLSEVAFADGSTLDQIKLQRAKLCRAVLKGASLEEADLTGEGESSQMCRIICFIVCPGDRGGV